MRKIVLGIMTAAVVFSLGTTSALAAGCGHGRNYKDENRDGICDNAAGICYFIDEDEDGICDYCDSECPQNNTKRSSRRSHCGGSRRHSGHHGRR